jgi:hypothetical protein
MQYLFRRVASVNAYLDGLRRGSARLRLRPAFLREGQNSAQKKYEESNPLEENAHAVVSVSGRTKIKGQSAINARTVGYLVLGLAWKTNLLVDDNAVTGLQPNTNYQIPVSRNLRGNIYFFRRPLGASDVWGIAPVTLARTLSKASLAVISLLRLLFWRYLCSLPQVRQRVMSTSSPVIETMEWSVVRLQREQ